MSFLYPLGLLGLIAVPVLILIYILKRKYTEQVIPSTYLWTLSERFLKHKNPISRITGIISLILQILVVVFISLAIANPVFVLKGRANDYCFVLDGSGSMNIVSSDGVTRFEKGKDWIENAILSSADGSYYTLVTTGETTDVVFKDVDDKKSAIEKLSEVAPSQVASDYTNALTVAQGYFSHNPSMSIVLLSDKTFESHNNVEVVNLSSGEQNYAVSSVEYQINSSGTQVSGKLYSYESDATLDVDVYADGSSQPVATKSVPVTKSAAADFTIDVGDQNFSFSSLRVAVRQSDALALDNEVMVYHRESASSYKTLIVSKTPFFLNATFATFGNLQRYVVSPDDYDPATCSGYGLYIFDNFTPQTLPTDGAVWFVNPTASVEGSGFSRRGEEELESARQMAFSTSTSTKVRNLLKDTLPGEQISVIKYVKCGLYSTFTTLMTLGGDPLIFAGSTSSGNREVVLAFSLQENTDFVLSYNYTVIMRNLINYTFPALVEGGTFYCGDDLTVNVLTGCTSIRLESPQGKIEYLDTSSASAEYEMTEVGEYTVTATINNVQQTVNVYCSLPETERFVSASEKSFSINGEPGTLKRDGRYDDLLYIFIILAVLVIADWMVYCYEQYQLR